MAPNFLKHAFETFETRIHTPSTLQPNSMMPIHPHGGATCSIIWQGNPIGTVKTFATPNCTLCAKERIEILKQSKSNPQLFINSNNEICGAGTTHTDPISTGVQS